MFDWSDEKDAKLRKERGIGFQEIVFHLERGDLLLIGPHLNAQKYSHQRIMYVRVEDYVYLVTFVELKDRCFLKTIIPSRKATKRLLED